MATNKIDLKIQPRQFFQEKITAAQAKNNIAIDTDVEFYLITLLCDFIQPSSPHLLQLDKPLALFLKETLEAPPHEQTLRFKILGDLSLYVSGYFQESFNRRVIDVDYYITVGSIAYRTAATRVGNSSRHVYEKLSQNFAALVELVAEVAVIPTQTHAVDILATYDRWTRSNSQRLLRMLLDIGIDPIKTNTKTPQ